jgi:hypothetical protein
MSAGSDGNDLALVIRALRNSSVSPRYPPSWITYWNTATYPIRGMTPRSVDG